MSREETELQRYYKEIFPVENIFRWLRYTRGREFSFTLKNGIYVRYLSFKSPLDFRNKLLMETPEKIDIGAVFLKKPANVSEMNPFMAKELIFDVDLTDYRRKCCSDKDLCCKCFPLIKCAVKVLHLILTEHLGLHKMLFVFSGGRGMHCWVSDPLILGTDARDRSNILEYICMLQKREIIDERIDQILLQYRETCAEAIGAEETNSSNGLLSLYHAIFPKIDGAVTKQPKHLLKSPFCIHPRSQRVCVPLFLESLDAFSLEEVPTLSQVVSDASLLSKYGILFSMYVNSLWES